MARRARLSGERGGVIAARCIRSIFRMAISSTVGAGVRSSVQLPGIGLRDVVVVEAADHDLLFAAERPADFNFVAGANRTILLGRLTVYRNLPAVTRLLCLGPRTKQARDIQPDVQAKGVDSTHASNSCTTREFC